MEQIELRPAQNLWRQAIYDKALAKTGNPTFAGITAAQLYKESRFNPASFNTRSGAKGIAQINNITARELNVDPEDPNASVDAAIDYNLRNLRRFNNNYAMMLAAYNWGPTALQEALEGKRTSIPRETKNYTSSIFEINNAFVSRHGDGELLADASDFDIELNLNPISEPTVVFSEGGQDVSPEAEAIPDAALLNDLMSTVENLPPQRAEPGEEVQESIPSAEFLNESLPPLQIDAQAEIDNVFGELLGDNPDGKSEDKEKTEKDVRNFVDKLVEAHIG